MYLPRDGATQCGLYCALTHTLAKQAAEDIIDPFHAVMAVVRSRRQFVASMVRPGPSPGCQSCHKIKNIHDNYTFEMLAITFDIDIKY